MHLFPVVPQALDYYLPTGDLDDLGDIGGDPLNLDTLEKEADEAVAAELAAAEAAIVAGDVASAGAALLATGEVSGLDAAFQDLSMTPRPGEEAAVA